MGRLSQRLLLSVLLASTAVWTFALPASPQTGRGAPAAAPEPLEVTYYYLPG